MLGLPISSILRIGSSSSAASPLASSSRQPFLGAVPSLSGQNRAKSDLAPRRTKYKKAQKGRVAIPTGGSIKGTLLEHGTFGLRTLGSVRMTADQLSSAQTAIKRKIKPVKGAEVFMRVFPDVPVCVKGNETRMGKGKGGFEYWACRVPVGRVVFEIGGGGIREEIAKQALRLAQVKLPVRTEFITTAATPRLGAIASSSLSLPASALPSPAKLVELDAKREGGAVGVIMAREERAVAGLEDVVAGLENVKISEEVRP